MTYTNINENCLIVTGTKVLPRLTNHILLFWLKNKAGWQSYWCLVLKEILNRCPALCCKPCDISADAECCWLSNLPASCIQCREKQPKAATPQLFFWNTTTTTQEQLLLFVLMTGHQWALQIKRPPPFSNCAMSSAFLIAIPNWKLPLTNIGTHCIC